MDKGNARGKCVLAGAALAAVGFCNSARATVVIQEIYGDGGFAAGTTYQNDYVQLYNNSSVPVSVAGYSLEYGSYSQPLGGFTATTNAFDIITLTGTAPIAAGGYYLIELPVNGTNTSQPFPAANQVATNSASAFKPSYYDAKVGLVDTTGTLIDYVGYGTDLSASASAGVNAGMTYPAYEGTGGAAGPSGSTSPTFTGTNAITRVVFTDDTTTTGDTTTENNLTDFVTDAPNPIAATSVPEPVSIGVVAAGGAMMIARRRNRK